MTVFPARVLLATSDGRDTAPAVRAAVDLCEKADAELHVARVVRALPPHVYPGKRPEEYEDVYALQVENALQEIARPVEDAGGRVAGAHLGVGDDAAREVLRLGEDIGAGRIVLGGRGLGFIERLVGGSVREALIARASVPVLVVGDGGWPPARVVVWDDSSGGARRAGELAVGVGGFYAASAVLLRVVPGGREAEGRYEESGEPLARWAARLEGWAAGGHRRDSSRAPRGRRRLTPSSRRPKGGRPSSPWAPSDPASQSERSGRSGGRCSSAPDEPAPDGTASGAPVGAPTARTRPGGRRARRRPRGRRSSRPGLLRATDGPEGAGPAATASGAPGSGCSGRRRRYHRGRAGEELRRDG